MITIIDWFDWLFTDTPLLAGGYAEPLISVVFKSYVFTWLKPLDKTFNPINVDLVDNGYDTKPAQLLKITCKFDELFKTILAELKLQFTKYITLAKVAGIVITQF